MHIAQLLVLTSIVRFVCGDLIANPYLQRAHSEAKNLMRHATPGNRRAAEVSVDNNPAAMEGAQGYLNFDIYHDVDNCADEPWVYYGLSLSYCYLGESGGSVQYTCVEDEVSNTVNLTLNAFSDTKCATPSMSLEITRERNACVEGNVWSCSSNQEPWDVMNGTLGWLYTDKKCKKLFAYYVITDGCQPGDGDGVELQCNADGYTYSFYDDDTTCSSEVDDVITNTFDKCAKAAWDDDDEEVDDYYADDGDDEDDTYNPYATADYKTHIASCCAGDDNLCKKNSKVKDSNNVCFAASEMVTTPTGRKTISEVSVGDSVLSMTAEGTYKFADVVYVPHAANTISSSFITLTTPTTSIKATPKHLLPAAPCSAETFPLMEIENVPVGYCVMTVQHGKQPVVESGVSQGAGVYTIVTSEPNGHIVVNDVVASSFGVNHAVANTYYQLHRMMYQMAPYVSKWLLFNNVNTLVGKLVSVYVS